ncbi:MAG: translocation/assembly module TamB, partial [Flavobacteriales bacterium]|nr:translocation/assembly module TamB [Flavobacteriales bacterium]
AEYQQKIQNIQMNFDLEITDDAKVQIIFDEKVGDVIKTTGNGEMKMEINSLGKFNLFGEYVIFKGDYLFTLQNIINKKFDIVEGSKITWNGDPYSALLDIKTIYRLKAPLSDIMSTVDSSNSYNRRVPVDCYLNLSNELMSPNIEFDIDLPSAENEVLDAFNGLISKEGEINRQFFSLLVLNRFIAPDNETAVRSNVGTTNTTEMMSHQISNWLSKISNDFDVGFKYRPGDEISDEEIELALSTQLFNDRLSIEGNFGMTGNNANATQTNNLVGDVLVEYKVKKDGSVSLKAYNSSNEFNIVDATTSQDTQGVGVLFRKDFSSFKELFRSIFKFGRKEDDQ